MDYALGFDGGGTKTECVLMDREKKIVARTRSGPSNPLRTGFEEAAREIVAAGEAAITETRISRDQVLVLCAGLGGAGKEPDRERMRELLLRKFPNARVEVCTDMELSLDAVGEIPAVALIAGTGSAVLGKNGAGLLARSGGLGPNGSDEGSAFEMGKKAVELLQGGKSSPLAAQILMHLGCESWAAVRKKAASNADEIFPRVFPVLAVAADAGDKIAQQLLQEAAARLAGLVDVVVRKLNLRELEFALGKTGGTMGRSRFFDSVLESELSKVAPKAVIREIKMSAAEAAGRRAVQAMPAENKSNRSYE